MHNSNTLPQPLRDLPTYVEQLLKDWNVPGLAVAIVKDDELIFAHGFGMRRRGEPLQVTAQTLFAIGSLTKAFTAALIAILVDEAKLSWDDRVVQYLPGFQLSDPYVTHELTIRDLLTARSGLVDGDLLWYGSAYDRDEIVYRLRYLQPRAQFRTTLGAYTLMYLVAGQIVAAVTGQSWDTVVRERIFVPLGMTTSSTSVRAPSGAANVATPHAPIDQSLQAIPWRNVDNVGPAGAINASVFELAQWMRLHLGRGSYNGRRLISVSALDEMHTPQVIIHDVSAREIFNPDAQFMTYGLGWYVHDYRGRKILEHGGAIDGMGSLIALIPDEQLGLVVLSNAAFTPQLLTALKFKIIDAYLNVPVRDRSAEFLQAHRAAAPRAEPRPIPGTSPSLALPRYAGTYVDRCYGAMRVAWEHEQLMLHFGAAFVGALQHWHYDTFQVIWQDRILGTWLVTFILNQDGDVAKLTIPQLTEFTRVAEDVGGTTD